jgi:glycosyltransferase involved in cell wall biosynthesis
MQVLVPVASADLGGSQRALLRLIDACGREPLSFRCWLFSAGPLERELDRRGIPSDRFAATSLRTPAGLVRLARHLRRERPDVIYLHASRVIALLARLIGIPCLERINMPRARGAGGWCRYRSVDRLLSNWNTRLLVVSASLAEQLVARGVAREKIVVFRDVVFPEEVWQPQRRAEARAALGLPPDAILLLSIGRMVRQKAQEDFVAVAAALCDDDPRLRFLLVGEGPWEARLRRAAQPLGDRFRILPFREDVAALYAAADLYVQTSAWEGLANVILEALAARLPIVATDVDGTREALGESSRHRLVPPRDVAALARAVRELLPIAGAPREACELDERFTPRVVSRHFGEIVRAACGPRAATGESPR